MLMNVNLNLCWIYHHDTFVPIQMGEICMIKYKLLEWMIKLTKINSIENKKWKITPFGFVALTTLGPMFG